MKHLRIKKLRNSVIDIIVIIKCCIAPDAMKTSKIAKQIEPTTEKIVEGDFVHETGIPTLGKMPFLRINTRIICHII